MIHKYKISILFLLMLGSYSIVAQSQTKEVFNKNYKASNKTLALDNTFGNINVTLWDKQEYAILVELKTEGFSEKEFDKLLEKLKVDATESGNTIGVQTAWESQNISNSNKKSFEVNYSVKTPKNGQLSIENSFGNLSVPDYDGLVKLKLKYGNIQAGKLANGEIQLSFGGGYIEALKNGELEAKYADKLSIGQLGRVSLKTSFSDVKIKLAEELSLEAKYGSLEIDQVNSIKGSASFSGLEIDLLKESLKIEAKYISGKLAVNRVAAGFKSIDIESKFSQVMIVFDPKCNFQFETAHKFGELKSSNDFKMTVTNKNDNSEDYKGYLGSSNANTLVKVITSYGDLTLETE